MRIVRILFMGASRLVGLLEQFQAAAHTLGIGLEMYSLEDNAPWHAIGVAGLARLVPAPVFTSSEFPLFLLQFVKDKQVDIVIPNIDSATIALASSAAALSEAGVLPLCASLTVCQTMADKQRADEVFRQLGLRTPTGAAFPLLAKPRFGASSRGIVKLHDAEELNFWKRRNRIQDFLLQPFIAGTEYSLDAYVERRGKVMGIVSRVRVVVAAGEVMITRTERNDKALEMAERLLRWERWHGPVTIQIIDDGELAWLLECNPRFGSGVACSIKAGLAIPDWILRERLGLPLPDSPIQWRDGLCLTRSRKDHFLWLS